MNELANPFAPLGPVTVTGYLDEIRWNAEAGLYEFDRLDAAARQWLASDEKAIESARSLPTGKNRVAENAALHEHLGTRTNAQTELFAALEAFLTLWARSSLLVFPAEGRLATRFTRSRGRCLRQLLGIDERHALAEREARDAWMHFDERLDGAVVRQTWGSRRRFVRKANEDDPRTALTLLEVEPLVLWYRDRDDQSKKMELPILAGALRDVRARIEVAYERVSALTVGREDLIDLDLRPREIEQVLPRVARKRAFARGLDVLEFSGTLTDEDARTLRSLLLADTGRVDANGW